MLMHLHLKVWLATRHPACPASAGGFPLLQTFFVTDIPSDDACANLLLLIGFG